MGRFCLQLDPEEEECSELDSYGDLSYDQSNDESDPASRSHRSLSNSSVASFHRFSKALTRFQRGPLEDGEIPEDIDVIPEEEEEEEEEHYHPRQLTRFVPQQRQMYRSHSAPIHYHIYYTAPPQPQPQAQTSAQDQPQSQSQSTTPWKWIAVVAILSHFVYIYGQSSSMWPMWQEWRFWTSNTVHSLLWASRFSPPVVGCSTMINNIPLFGQDLALERLQTAMQDFSALSKSQGPLMIYATGGPGVGKRHMARLMAQSCSRSLLEIDLSIVINLEDLKDTIRDHLVAHDYDSVVLFSHFPDEEETSRVSRILQILQNLVQESLDSWQNVIVFFTSYSGAATIDKTIRYYGKDNIPRSELVWHLRQSLVHYSYLESAVILPFLPLDRLAVEAIVQQEMMMKMRVDVSSLTYLLDHALEWRTWIHKQTQTELYTFLPNGGHDVNLLIHQLMPPMGACGDYEKDSTWLYLQEDQLRLVSCAGHSELEECQEICKYPL